MEAVIIVTSPGNGIDFMSRLEQAGKVTVEPNGIVVVTSEASRIYVVQDNAVRDEFEPEELRLIAALIQVPIFYLLEFSDLMFCKKVLEIAANDPKLMVDNDHGTILPGNEFVRILRNNQGWDWRRE